MGVLVFTKLQWVTGCCETPPPSPPPRRWGQQMLQDQQFWAGKQANKSTELSMKGEAWVHRPATRGRAAQLQLPWGATRPAAAHLGSKRHSFPRPGLCLFARQKLLRWKSDLSGHSSACQTLQKGFQVLKPWAPESCRGVSGEMSVWVGRNKRFSLCFIWEKTLLNNAGAFSGLGNFSHAPKNPV